MQRWVDVNPTDWYYRDVLQANKIQVTPKDDYLMLIEGIAYNAFAKPRLTQTHTSTDGQIDFDLPGYIPDDANPVLAFVDGIQTMVDKTEPDKVYLTNPVSAGLEIILIAAGEPAYDSSGRPYQTTGGIYPKADLSHKATYEFNIYYTFNESCVVLGRALRRVEIDPYLGEDVNSAVARVFDTHNDVFTIVDGTVYVPYIYNNLPAIVCYNYREGNGGRIIHTCERVIPTSPAQLFNDRFFPNVNLYRYEFFVLLGRMKESIFNRFADRTFSRAYSNIRNVSDVPTDSWYTEYVIDLLDDKFLDGCFVYPLYDDGTFKPTANITRAEAAVYLHRFIEWAVERFR